MLLLTVKRKRTRSWRDFPTDILNQILELLHGSDVSTAYRNKKDLVQCQLVCQAWNKPAQYFLYKDICLGANALKFTNTISESQSTPRILVNNIHFSLQFADHLGSIHNFIHFFSVIVERCPNIQYISIHPSCQHALLPTLLAESGNLTNLCSIQKTDFDDNLDFVVYGAICFRQTLKRLSLAKRSNWSSIETSQFNYLFSRLGSFPNLTTLYICLLRFLSFQEFHSIIDSCQSLQLLKFNASSHGFILDNATIASLPSNNSIKHLHATDIRFDDNTISYISKKFKRLQGLVVHVSSSLWSTLPNFWKKSVIPYLKTLQSYTVNFNIDNYVRAKACIEQISSKRVHQRSKLAIEVHVYDCESLHNNTRVHNTGVTISHKDNSEKIKLHICWYNVPAFVRNSLNPTLLSLRPYELRMIGLNKDGHEYKTRRDRDFRTLRRPRGYYDNFDDDDSWAIFDSILQNCDKNYGYNLMLGGLVFQCTSPTPQNNIKPVSVSNLTIERSLLHVEILPAISWRLDKVSTLKLDLCDFTGDTNRQRLKVHFPSTSVHTLKINFPPSYASNDPCNHPELLKGLSKDSNFILKIETEVESYCSYQLRSEQLSLRESFNYLTGGIVTGVEPFVLWIKCRKLERLVITDGDGLVLDMDKNHFPKC